MWGWTGWRRPCGASRTALPRVGTISPATTWSGVFNGAFGTCGKLSLIHIYACDYIQAHFEGVRVSKPQGTYMLFLDCTEWCAAHGKTIDEVQQAGWDAVSYTHLDVYKRQAPGKLLASKKKPPLSKGGDTMKL